MKKETPYYKRPDGGKTPSIRILIKYGRCDFIFYLLRSLCLCGEFSLIRARYIAFPLLFILSINSAAFAQGNIVDYFLKDPKAWEDTKRIIHKKPVKVVVREGLSGIGFNLSELTEGDTVALVFIDAKKAEKMKVKGFYNADDKLLPGINRVVSVITRNAGSRTQFHYKFMLQRNINNEPITIYNNGNAVLESLYDGSRPVKDISNLSGIELCEIEVDSGTPPSFP